MAVVFSSCFTGVESTGKISLSKEDIRNIRPSDEDLFLADVKGTPLADWKPGKSFTATDNKAVLVFDQQGLPYNPDAVALKGKTLSFTSTSTRPGPDGKLYLCIEFSNDSDTYIYNTGKQPDPALKEITSADIPMLVDNDMISRARSLMAGKTLWLRTNLWYDDEGNKIAGRKFIPVKILDISPGSVAFPLYVEFQDEDGNKAWTFMNFGNSSTDSRSFSHVFYLNDVRKRYRNISDEVWNLICNGAIKTGMTKEECKLSIGNPTEVSSGHDYSQTLDLWHYPDGTVLWFEDGLLSRFRR